MDQWQTPTLGINLRIPLAFPTVFGYVTSRLKQEGFVVHAFMDIQDTLKRKLNVDTQPFQMMRVYNPALITRAKELACDVILLPYNITIARMEDGTTELTMQDPLSPLTVLENPAIQPIVSEAHHILQGIAYELERWR